MENIYRPCGGDMKLSLQTIKKHWDISDDFPAEVEVLVKHTPKNLSLLDRFQLTKLLHLHWTSI